MVSEAKPQMHTRVFGKWILCGEHAVLRGSPALVFPVYEKSFELSYFLEPEELSATFEGERGEEMRVLFWGVFDRAMELLKRSRSEVKGLFKINNDIAVGAGMGASAALCVAIGRWFVWKGWVREEALYDFSRELENLFHGESSGVDVAVAISRQGLYFKRDGTRRNLHPAWSPNWYLSYSGKRGLTSECVAKVKKLGDDKPEVAREIDEKMKESVAEAERALLSAAAGGFEKLVSAIQKAASCFVSWELVSHELQAHMDKLRQHGAAAVKPTGSGEGGFVLSLWEKNPPAELLSSLIKVTTQTRNS